MAIAGEASPSPPQRGTARKARTIWLLRHGAMHTASQQVWWQCRGAIQEEVNRGNQSPASLPGVAITGEASPSPPQEGTERNTRTIWLLHHGAMHTTSPRVWWQCRGAVQEEVNRSNQSPASLPAVAALTRRLFPRFGLYDSLSVAAWLI